MIVVIWVRVTCRDGRLNLAIFDSLDPLTGINFPEAMSNFPLFLKMVPISLLRAVWAARDARWILPLI